MRVNISLCKSILVHMYKQNLKGNYQNNVNITHSNNKVSIERITTIHFAGRIIFAY